MTTAMKLPWAETLRLTIKNLRQRDRAPRVAIVGIGQTLRGDDAAGAQIARRLEAALRERPVPSWLVLDGGPAPENVTGALRRFAPDLVLLIDCAQMDEPPGTIRWLDWRDTSGVGASSHALPPSLLAHYLVTGLGCTVALLGIQPAQTEVGAELSHAVEEAAQAVEMIIRQLLVSPDDERATQAVDAM